VVNSTFIREESYGSNYNTDISHGSVTG
jgi:hypothetical protein